MQGIERENKDCEAINSHFCLYVGSEGCDKCIINSGSVRTHEIEEMTKAWETTRENLPDDIDEFHNSTKCRLSKDGTEDATEYIIVDMVHPEPVHMRGMFFGFGKKVQSPVGSMLQVPIPVCKAAARYVRMKDVYKWGIIILGLLVGVLGAILSAPLITGEAGMIIPAAVIALGTGIGVLCSNLFSNNWTKKHAHKLRVDVREVPMIAEMLKMGWSFFNSDKSGAPTLFIAKKKPRPHVVFKSKDNDEQSQEQAAQVQE